MIWLGVVFSFVRGERLSLSFRECKGKNSFPFCNTLGRIFFKFFSESFQSQKACLFFRKHRSINSSSPSSGSLLSSLKEPAALLFITLCWGCQSSAFFFFWPKLFSPFLSGAICFGCQHPSFCLGLQR